MKFLHISDLHIGKRLNEFSLIEDQIYILNQILEIAKEQQADGIFIAGDIYDKPIPSAEAVKVFDLFLTRLADHKIKVFAISGNHDSPERIAFGAQLMSRRDVYVSPVYDGTAAKISLTDAYGELYVYLLPFLKPAVVRHVLEMRKNKICRKVIMTRLKQRSGEWISTKISEIFCLRISLLPEREGVIQKLFLLAVSIRWMQKRSTRLIMSRLVIFIVRSL